MKLMFNNKLNKKLLLEITSNIITKKIIQIKTKQS